MEQTADLFVIVTKNGTCVLFNNTKCMCDSGFRFLLPLPGPSRLTFFFNTYIRGSNESLFKTKSISDCGDI